MALLNESKTGWDSSQFGSANGCETASNCSLIDKLKQLFRTRTIVGKKAREADACDSCSKILHAIRDRHRDHLSLKLGSIEQLFSANCSRHHALVEQVWTLYKELAQASQGRRQEYEISLWRDCSSSSVSFRFERNGQFDINNRTLPPFDVVRRFGSKNAYGQGLLLDPSWINADRLLEWYQHCKTKHSDSCSNPLYLAQSPEPNLQFLIDTVDWCLVVAPQPCSYVALSYVWGRVQCLKSTNANMTKLCQPGALKHPRIRDFIPKTILHAMHVVKAVGERYLWTDAFCIVQDDSDMMQDHLRSMASIYAHANLVIVAGAGSDADYGLHGLADAPDAVPRQLEQQTIPFGDDMLLKRIFFDDNDRSQRKDEYWSRGWTFQEYTFARRRLVFENESVCFECCTSTQYEDLKTCTERSVWDPMEFRYLLEVGYPSLTMYLHTVHRFNQKHLTYPEDCLGAFSGALTTFSKAFKGGFICGLPELFFDVALLWQPAQNLKRRLPSRQNRHQSNTASCVPSWSWAGWHGVLDQWSWATGCDFIAACSGLIAVTTRKTIPITTWYTADRPDSTEKRRINAEWSQWRDRYQNDQEKLPPGWRKHKRNRKSTLTNEYTPDGYGEYLYTNPHAQPQARFWYPVPICDPDPQPRIHPHTPYLFSRVQSAWLYNSGETIPPKSRPLIISDPSYNCVSVSLRDSLGKWAGVLRLHCCEDLEELQSQSDSSGTRIQVVAISRGSIPNGQEYADSFIEEYDHEERPKEGELYEYYDLIWLTWEEGIAYRKALGRVIRDVWESQELETIDLVLG